MSKRAPKRAAQERRRLILESAQTVFANSNYARVGTAELAKAAGVSEPALYRYFSGKRDLYISTLKATGTRLLRIWQRIAGGGGGPPRGDLAHRAGLLRARPEPLARHEAVL